MQRTLREYLLVAFKGVLMGAADVVPGVSGGTVAFITGIYEELIDSIHRFDLHALKLLAKGQLKAVWQYVNGTFLLALLSGIALSLVSLAQGVLYMLAHYPELLWAFFFWIDSGINLGDCPTHPPVGFLEHVAVCAGHRDCLCVNQPIADPAGSNAVNRFLKWCHRDLCDDSAGHIRVVYSALARHVCQYFGGD